MKKLKARMLLYFGGLLLVICIGLGIVAYTTSSGVLIQYSQETMPTFASEASKMMDTSISMHLSALEVIANNEYIIHMQDSDQYKAEVMDVLRNESARAGHIRMAVIDKQGRHYMIMGRFQI